MECILQTPFRHMLVTNKLILSVFFLPVCLKSLALIYVNFKIKFAQQEEVLFYFLTLFKAAVFWFSVPHHFAALSLYSSVSRDQVNFHSSKRGGGKHINAERVEQYSSGTLRLFFPYCTLLLLHWVGGGVLHMLFSGRIRVVKNTVLACFQFLVFSNVFQAFIFQNSEPTSGIVPLPLRRRRKCRERWLRGSQV